MHGRKSLILLLAAIIVFASQGATAQTPPAEDFYTSCVNCHALPVNQAQGYMGPHGGWGPPPPGFVDEACSMTCHEWTPPEGHWPPPPQPFFWQFLLDPFSYPPGPSVITQMCENCHDTSAPPLNGMHPSDQIPYLPTATTPPPPVLPLFDGTGLPNQDPNDGGLTCSTCHDPHEPGYIVQSTSRYGYLRVHEPSGDTLTLCQTCHTDTGQTIGHDLFIDSLTTSVTFNPPMFGWIDIDILVQNRGTIDYPGGNLDVFVDDGSGFTTLIGSGFVPAIPPGGSVFVLAGIPEDAVRGADVLQFALEPSQLNPARHNTFARAINAPPTPQNLQVMGVTDSYIDLTWDPPLNPNPISPPTYNVYRNGIKVNPWPLPEFETWFQDTGLAPGTPHTYTVEAVNIDGFASDMSNRVGASTVWISEIRVPQDEPTIDLAIQFASPGTIIRVAPGTYSMPFMAPGGGIAIKGQDANSCILDLALFPNNELSIDGGGPNSISGFTVINGRLVTGNDDTVSEMIFQSSPTVSIQGGGFVTNSIFEELGAPSIDVPFGQFVTVANSIFRTGYAIQTSFPPEEQVYLINNSFPGWWDWQWLPGENNFSEEPSYISPGPPERYFIHYGVGHDAGADVGLPYQDLARDVGVFEIGEVYTPRPPSALTAQWMSPGFVALTWQASADEDIYPVSYEVFRSEFSYFPGDDGDIPYASVPYGLYFFEDYGTVPGTGYYYQVRAVTTARSAATDNVFITAGGYAPVAVDDNYFIDEDTFLFEPPPGVLGNDTDDDGDPLSAVPVNGPSFARNFTFRPDGSFDYEPLPEWSGTDSFTYFAEDGFNISNTATVTIVVNPVNDPPIAVDDSYGMPTQWTSTGLLVLLNDSDPEGDPLFIDAVGLPDQGGTANNLGNVIDYAPAPGFVGVETFTYTVSDGNGGLSQAQITVNVINDPPTANDDSYATGEDQPLNVPAPGVLGNDTDLYDDPLTASPGTGPANGQLSLNVDGSFTYTPNANFFGSDSFTYSAVDPWVSSTPATVFITVGAVNDAPLLGAIGPQAVAEAAGINIGFAATDLDTGDTLSFTSPNLPSFCSITDNGNRTGSVSCSPGYDDAGSYDITVIVNDNGSPVLSDNETFTLTVTNVNRAPLAADDSYATDEDVALNIAAPGVLGNDFDPDGDILEAVLVGGTANGLLNLNPDGSFTYTPDAEYSGIDMFSYFAGDSLDASPAVFVTITVNSLNDAPVLAGIGAQNVAEGGSISLSLSASDVDAGDTLAFGASGLPGFCSLADNGNGTGSVDCSPGFGDAGGYDITVTVSDNGAPFLSDNETFTLTVTDVNRAPLASDDAYAVDEDTVLNVAAPGVLGNDTDPDSDPLQASLVSGTANGALLLNPDGSFTYTPNGNYFGPDSFTYVANDGGADSNIATVTITVNSVNDAPFLAAIGAQNVAEGGSIAIGLSASDVDAADILWFEATGLPAFCTLLDGGSRSGVLDCNPGYDDGGSYDITVTVTDNGTPVLSDNETFTLTVTNINRAPNVTNPGTQNNNEGDSGISLQIVASDADLDTLTYSASGLPAGLGIDPASGLITGSLDYSTAGTYNVDVSVTDGQAPTAVNFSWTVGNTNRAPNVTDPGPQSSSEGDAGISLQIVATDADLDTLTYSAAGLPAGLGIDPASGLITGSLDYSTAGTYNVDVSVTDGQAPTAVNFSWTVGNTNRAPNVTDPGPQSSSEGDAGISLQIVATDADLDTLTYSAAGLPAGLGIDPASGLITGSLGYASSGSYSVDVTVSDGQAPVAANFSWTVTEVNRAPVLGAIGLQSVAENGALNIPLSATDADAGDTLAFSATGLPTFCALTDNLDRTGSIDCSPGFDDTGNYDITVTVDDNGVPVLSDSELFPLTVNNTNRAPVVTNPGPQTNAEGDSAISLQIDAIDPDGDSMSYSATGLPPGLSINTATGLITGSLGYTSSGSYSVDVTVSDGQAPVAVNFSWTVTEVARMHVESITTGFSVDKGKTYYTADVLVLDDGGAPLAGVNVTAHWTGTNADSSSTTRATGSGGVATFTTNGIKKPGGVYIITITDVVKAGYTYDVEGSATSGQYPPPAQNPPVANDDSYAVDEGAVLNVSAPGVLGNDNDFEGDPLTAVLAGSPNHGSVNLNSDGSFDYTHDGSETTVDSFTYRANDGTADSNIATVTITVDLVNDPPTAADDSASTQLDTPVIVDVLANDTDPDGGALTVSAVTDGTYGSVVNNGSDVTYTPDSGYSGPDSFTYTAADGIGGFDTATVSVTVSAGNLPPTAVDDTAVTDQDTLIVVDVLANDSDPDGDTLSVSAVTDGTYGSVVNNGSDVTYTPDSGYYGPDSFTYTAADGNGGFDSATVNVTVIEVPTGSSMHIDDIAMTTSGRKVKKATATVTVVDAGGAPVEGVTVSGDWSGAMSGPVSGVTGPDGTVDLVSPGKKNVTGLTITITITNLAKSGWTYDPAADVQSSDSIVFP